MFNPWNRHPLSRTKTVGVTGLVQSGKTVLLTSLISHLRNHSPDRLRIGRNGTRVTEVRTLPLSRDATVFDARRFRDELANHFFPPKTLLTHEFRAEYVRTDWKRTRIGLHLIDFPGELLADGVIATHKHFDHWSDAVLRQLQRREFSDRAHPFLEALDTSGGLPSDQVEATLLRAYRTALARMVLSYMPIVTPSSFLPRGPIEGIEHATCDEQKVEILANQQFCGLDVERQFFPMPESLRKSHPAIRKALQSRYGDYRREVVLPMARRIRRCHELLVLVDIATLLEGGTGMLNANVLFLEQLLQAVDPGLSPPAAALNGILFGLFAGVRRIVFIATKADRVHPADHEMLRSLLEEMVRPIVGPYEARSRLQVAYRVCAAVECTQCPDPAKDVLVFPTEDSTVADPTTWKRITVSRVPTEWPGDFAPLQFRFARPVPWMPKALVASPRHIGLGPIAEAILS